MKAFLRLLPFLLVSCSEAPQEMTIRDRQGMVRAEVTRVGGKKDGPVRFFEANGSLRTVGMYGNDSRHGTWATVDDQGDTLSLLHFRDGRKDGIQAYWAANRQLLRVERFSDGEPDGPLYRFFSDGTPREVTGYDHGMQQGPYWEWYKSDSAHTALVRGGFDRGERDGMWHWSYANGRVQGQGRYVHGLKVGIWSNWDRWGRPTSRVDHGDGHAN